ncbi:MAG: hypothetical protein JWL90_2742 [Chthoniobacteraceae bacterium]|nr:hypothetical protein [Chthoniobacteraceae bacterium]
MPRIWFFAALFFTVNCGLAQKDNAVPPPAGHRPKIGLVLSGGGARGVAHIGVLKALEELHIPIDYIAGTSMGAIVGGLYASGMSPEELEQWFHEVDWRYLLSDAPPREGRSFRSKEREFRLNQNLELGISGKGNIQLPTGLIAGQKLIINLRELTLSVRDVHDFDRLPIPFRAVATDLETGEKVVLSGGDLPEAMRASMAVPGIFTPYRTGGRLLVDGGLASNLPIETVKAMGADIVIAVDLRTDLLKGEQLNSPLAVTNQVVDIFIQRDTVAQIGRLSGRDVYIRLHLPNATSSNFIGSFPSINAGYEETREHTAKLQALAVPEAAFQRYLARQRLPRERHVQIAFLKVAAPSGPVRRKLERAITIAPGERVEFWRIEKELIGLEAMRGYEVTDLHVIEENGEFGLLLEAERRRRGPNYLNVGFDFSFGSSGETDADLLLGYRLTELNSLDAEWETFVSIGDRTRIFSEWYQPLDLEQRFFLAANLLYGNEFLGGLNAEGERLRFRLTQFAAGLDMGMRLWDIGEFRLGYALGGSRVGRALGLPADTRTSGERAEIHATLTIDTLDRTNFPTHGLYLSTALAESRTELGAGAGYHRLDTQFYAPFTLGKNTWVPRITAGLALGGRDLPIYDQFSLGGFLNLSGLARRGLYDQNALLAQLVYYREIAKLPPGLGGGVYGGFSLEAGNVWKDLGSVSAKDLVIGGSLFLGADTLLGPLYFGVGMAERGETAIYLQLSPVFRRDRFSR